MEAEPAHPREGCGDGPHVPYVLPMFSEAQPAFPPQSPGDLWPVVADGVSPGTVVLNHFLTGTHWLSAQAATVAAAIFGVCTRHGSTSSQAKHT